MPQTLFPAQFPEGITFERTYMGAGLIHIGQLPGGGYARIDGQPIQSVEELTAVIPAGPRLTQALEWWTHHEDPEPDDEPPLVTWSRGKLIYVESGAELTSHAEIIQAFPENNPMQHAALEWFAAQQLGRHQTKQRQDLQTGVRSSSVESQLGQKRSHHAAKPKKSHHKKIAPHEHAPSVARAMAAHDTMVAASETTGP